MDLPLHCLVSLVERPNRVQVPVFRDDTFISDFDQGLCHASSSGLAQDLAINHWWNLFKSICKILLRLLWLLQRSTIMKLLRSKKWGISVSRAEATLKASTQLSLRSAIMPLWAIVS